MKEMDRLLNCHWWAQALVDRWKLDQDIAQMKRDAQVPVDAHLERLMGPDHELIEWERGWILERIHDALKLHLEARNEGRYVLSETEDEHHARAQHEKARAYFDGRTHDEEREHVKTQRHKMRTDFGMTAAHQRPPKDSDPAIHAYKQRAFDELHAAFNEQDKLVDRHIATVRAEVEEERRLAASKVKDGDTISSEPYQQLVDRMLLRVRDEIRALLS